MLFPRPIGEPEIAKIAAIADPVLRNLWITTAYHDFAVGMARLVGPANVAWPAFATWASKTAGASIRGEVLPGRIQEVLNRSWAYRRAMALVRLRLSGTLVDIDVDIFDAVARGGCRGEPRTSRPGTSRCSRSSGRSSRAWSPPSTARGRAIRRAAPRSSPGSRRSTDDAVATARLRTVFGQYCDAMLDGERALRADRILLANGLAGLTEQIRLQPNIQDALDAPIETSLGEWLDRTVAKLPEAVRAGVRPVLRLVVIEIEAGVAAHRHRALDEARDAQRGSGPRQRTCPRRRAGRSFPSDLEAIQAPELVALLAEYDRTGGTGIGSGANDWAKLPQRMNYILNLFRSRQQDGELLRPPFTTAQWAEMQEGRVPPGGDL